MEVIYGLKALLKAGFSDFKEIIYYTNGEEEGGSPTAEAIVAELSQQADFAVIMDVARLTGASLHSVRVMQSIRFR